MDLQDAHTAIDTGDGNDVAHGQTEAKSQRYCRDQKSGRHSRPELRATHCVQREYSWLLAALAQSRLAHSCPPRRSIITWGRRTTAMPIHHRTTATVTDGLGMTARPVGRFRVETVHPTKVRLSTPSHNPSGSLQTVRQTLAPPILLGLALHCWRFRVLDLDPMPRAATRRTGEALQGHLG